MTTLVTAAKETNVFPSRSLPTNARNIQPLDDFMAQALFFFTVCRQVLQSFNMEEKRTTGQHFSRVYRECC